MRDRTLCLLLVLICNTALADESPVHITAVETPDLRLYYYDYLADIAPLAIRTFTNAREWQRRMFGWMPSERTTVVLQDFADYGNARAFAAPRGTLILDVAPLSRAFETSPAGERMYTTMSHELVHVLQSDISSPEDQWWRKLFLGKVAAQSRNPETLLYSYLTTPRFNAPRWYAEGGAVFLETFMAGGLGRAQGGYDEMVFRAMVRDDAHFYSPLGLVSRGTMVEFPDRRQRVPLRNAFLHVARVYVRARQADRMDATRRGKRALLLGPVSGGIRLAARGGVGSLGRVRARVPAKKPRGGPRVPDHAKSQARRERTRVGFPHALRRGDRYPLRRLSLSRRRRARRCSQHAGRHRTAAGRHQGRAALHGRVVCLRSDERHRVLHQRQQRVTQPDGRRRANGQGTDAARTR